MADIVDNNAMVGGVRSPDAADAPTDGFNALLDIVLKGSQQKKGSLDFLRRLSQGLQLINGAGASASSKLGGCTGGKRRNMSKLRLHRR